MTTQTLEKKLGVSRFAEANQIYTHLLMKYPPKSITSKRAHQEYSHLAGRLMAVLEDDIPANDRKGIEQYLNVLVPLIEAFEKEHFPIGEAEPEEVLRFLMEQHDLKETDLAKELGGQSVVSMVLNGKRQLSRTQVKRLSRRFHVSEATFYPSSR